MAERVIDIDERIARVFGSYISRVGETAYILDISVAAPAIKQLIREVIEEIKPAREIHETSEVNTCLLKYPHRGPCAGLGVEQVTTVVAKQCDCVDELEANVKRIGL